MALKGRCCVTVSPCHRAIVSPVHTDFSTPTPTHTQIPFIPLFPSFSFNFLPPFWHKQWLFCAYNTKHHRVISSMNQTVETLEFFLLIFFSLFLSIFFHIHIILEVPLTGRFSSIPFFDNFYILLLS